MVGRSFGSREAFKCSTTSSPGNIHHTMQFQHWLLIPFHSLISQCKLYPILQLIPVFVDEQFSKADEDQGDNVEEDDEERVRKVPRPGDTYDTAFISSNHFISVFSIITHKYCM